MNTRHNTIFLVVIFGTLFLAAAAFAASPNPTDPRFTNEKLDLIQQNLVLALKSNSPGMQTSAALVLLQVKNLNPEYDFSTAIIPLMAIVKNEDFDVQTRIASALALHSIRSETGDFAIRRTAEFTSQEKLRHLCGAMNVERMEARNMAQ